MAPCATQFTAASKVPAAAPPVATVTAAATAMIPAPTANFAQLGSEAFPSKSYLLTGLLAQ